MTEVTEVSVGTVETVETGAIESVAGRDRLTMAPTHHVEIMTIAIPLAVTTAREKEKTGTRAVAMIEAGKGIGEIGGAIPDATTTIGWLDVRGTCSTISHGATGVVVAVVGKNGDAAPVLLRRSVSLRPI